MTAEQQHKQEWIEQYIEDALAAPAKEVLAAALQLAEAAWQKRNEDGPEDSGDAWEGGFAWNH